MKLPVKCYWLESTKRNRELFFFFFYAERLRAYSWGLKMQKRRAGNTRKYERETDMGVTSTGFALQEEL